MLARWNRLIKNIVVPASVVVLGIAAALWAFTSAPQQQIGAPAPAPTSAPTVTRTPARGAPQQVGCAGGETTLEQARKYAGFKLLAPAYLPENLQLSLVSMYPMVPESGFRVGLYYRNLMTNAPLPWLAVYQYPTLASTQPLRPDQKASPIIIRGVQGQLIEPLEPPNTPAPPGPNPTLTAWALGLITPDMRTPVSLAPCPWINTQVTTPIPWTPNAGRTTSAPPTPYGTTTSLTLRWTEAGVQILVEGTYSRQELLKVAESLR